MKHTPTPWTRVFDDSIGSEALGKSIIDDTYPADIDDLNFIVTACNAHDTLVSAIRLVVEWGKDPFAAPSGARTRFIQACNLALMMVEQP